MHFSFMLKLANIHTVLILHVPKYTGIKTSHFVFSSHLDHLTLKDRTQQISLRDPGPRVIYIIFVKDLKHKRCLVQGSHLPSFEGFYPKNLSCTPKICKPSYISISLCIEGIKLRKLSQCTLNFTIQWEPCWLFSFSPFFFKTIVFHGLFFMAPLPCPLVLRLGKNTTNMTLM